MKTLIVGAGSGIGRALAFEMAARGHDLILAGRARSKLDEVASGIRAEHTSIDVTALTVDLADTGECQGFCSELLALTHKINNLVYCAGVGEPSADFASLDPADLQKALAVNATAPATLIHGLLPILSGNHPLSRIVLMGAGVDRRIQPGTLSYGVSKMALRRLFEQLSVELKPDQGAPAVSLLQPGLVDTQGLQDHLSKARLLNLPHATWLKQRLSAGDCLSPEQAASVIAYTLDDVPVMDFHGQVFHGPDLADSLFFSAS
ncbi:MAG: SDR family NAD(P)-dependent oxidoreductase [Pseudomonadota bacterium]